MDSSTSMPQDYEKFRNDIIERGENQALAAGAPQPPRLVREHLTLGFGYEFATRKSDPQKILVDLAAAGITLTGFQTAAILFYGGWSRGEIWRNFGVLLNEDDRTDAGLLKLLGDFTVTKPQGEALLKIIVKEKEKELDDLLRKSELPRAELDRFHKDSDQRAVLVDMYYQSRNLFGHALLDALKTHDDAAAALEIAFLSNKNPHATPGDDERDFERALTFLGGTLAPRNEAEARAFLGAMRARSDALTQALAKRRGDARLAQPYLDLLNEVARASLGRLGITTKLTLQPDGRWLVGSEVPLAWLAKIFGLSPLALALVNPRLFPTAPDSATLFPANSVLHLPSAAERTKLRELGVGIGWEERGAAPTPELYDKLLRGLRPPPQQQQQQRQKHGALEGERFLASLSPAMLAYADRLAPYFEYQSVSLAAVRPLFELPAGYDQLPDASYVAHLGAGWALPPPTVSITDQIEWPLVRPRRGISREAYRRIEAAIERCVRTAEELNRQLDRWIERRNAAMRRSGFY